LEKSTLLKCPYYAKQVADSTQFSSKYQWYLCETKKIKIKT
jgi:hypothetical protein